MSSDQMVRMASTGLTGRFPITSARGKSCVFLLYDYNFNAILVSPIKDHKKESLISGLYECLGILKNAGIQPVLLHLDNGVSKDMVSHIQGKEITYQLASPGDH